MLRSISVTLSGIVTDRRPEQLAKAYRLKYLKIENNSDVDASVKKFLKAKGSVLLEVIVDEDGIVRKGDRK